MNNKRIVITPGEPAGIGPDLVVALSQHNWPVELVICADPDLLTDRAQQLGLPLMIHPYQPEQKIIPRPAGEITVLAIDLLAQVVTGVLNVTNSNYVLATIARACDGCINGEFSALVTGPVHKGIINDSGIPFRGHTEYFAQRSSKEMAVMMFVNESMRVALATTHLPLRDIPKTITSYYLDKVISILLQDLQNKFGIAHPCIYVCGLNPHAGEGGYIGREEIDVIIPTLDTLRLKGYNIIGPIPADTIFLPKYIQNADAVLALYHDQCLPVIKHQGLGNTVNITLGLPFIRTSVDHGTSIELAGSNQVNTDSMKKALNLAIDMIKIRNE